MPSIGEERLDAKAPQRLNSLLRLGDPNGEVAIDYRVKERLREFCRNTDIDTSRTMLSELIEHCLRPGLPPELNKLAPHPESLVRQDLQIRCPSTSLPAASI